MSKKLIHLFCFVLILTAVLASSANAQDPSLVGYWKLDDEGTGTVLDYSGNDRHGTINGDPQFVPGLFGQAMQFTGDPDYVNIGGYKGLLGGHAFTIAAWIKTAGNGEIVGWGNNSATERVEFRLNESRLRTEHGSGNRQGDTVVSDNQWHHVALTVQENSTISYPQVILYLDGEDDTRTGTSSNAFNIVENFDLSIARQYSSSNRWFIGLMDEVRVYDRALSAEEIQNLAVPPKAHKPIPADGAVHSETWININFSPGGGAVSHDVYFGDNFADVNSGAENAFLANQTDTNFAVGIVEFPYPEGL
ncbi:MAG: LamG domain-containing protein, partial [Planctomycetota bacterium]